jgi:hypothetical protein
MEDLEVTSAPALPPAPTQAMDELELTGMPPQAPVPAEKIAELEVGRYQDPDPKTPERADGSVACRYCGQAQKGGLVCERCGMRLPNPLKAGAGTLEGTAGRCRSCGSLVSAGSRCGECGTLA